LRTTSFDIAIAGAGIGGLAAALLLHRDGHRVQLFERFDNPRPLGSGLMIQPSGMAVLDALGLADSAMQRGAPISRLFGRNAAGRTVLDARYADLPGPPGIGLGIHRASLFGLLFDAVLAAKIPIAGRSEIAGSTCTGSKRRLHFEGGPTSGPFDLVIDALGIHTPLAPPAGRMLEFGALWASLPWPEQGPFDSGILEQRYRGAREMVGVLPTGRRTGARAELALFWSLHSAKVAQWQAAGLEAWRTQVADLWPAAAPLAEQIRDPEQLVFARYAHRTLPHPAGDRIVHIGDAWHSASPQLGQGANMALLDAWGVAEALRLTRDTAATPAMAVQLRNWHVQLYQWATALFTPMYQSEAAFPAAVRDWLLAPASRVWPGKQVQALLMSGLFGAPLKPLRLARSTVQPDSQR
jgi:2-polyprenyl-6-methoxyphenol hydroxylase-like FAD-dependent oxidoreductase